MFDGWPIEEFARSAGARSLAMLTGFLDDTGTHDGSPVVGVLGMVSSMAEWARFEFAWKKQLKAYGVPCFHAVDCEHGNKKFVGIEAPERDALRRGLIGVMGVHRALIVGSAVIRKDWDETVPEETKAWFGGDPIYFCFEHCMQQLSKWSREHRSGELVSIVFAQQQQHQAKIGRLHDYYYRSHYFSNLGSFAVAKPECVIPLQAADFVAYESYLHLGRRLKNQPQRWQVTELLQSGVANISSFHDRETLGVMLLSGPQTFAETVSASASSARSF